LKATPNPARAFFQSWFVDFDLVRSKVEGRDTGLPPEIDALFPEGFEKIDGGSAEWVVPKKLLKNEKL
jgi:hypothetical protein